MGPLSQILMLFLSTFPVMQAIDHSLPRPLRWAAIIAITVGFYPWVRIARAAADAAGLALP